jgi:hypothetical protein
MTAIADMVRALHDIDAAKGRVCGRCLFGNAGTYKLGLGCKLGYAPASQADGCEDFLRRPGAVFPSSLARQLEAAKTHQQPRHESGGVS